MSGGTDDYTPEFYAEQQRLAREHEALAVRQPLEPTRSIEEIQAAAEAMKEQRVKDMVFAQFDYLREDEKAAYIQTVRDESDDIDPALIRRVLRDLAIARWSAHCADIH